MKSKGLSEIVSILMLIGITIIGAVIVQQYLTNTIKVDNAKLKGGILKLVGYDSRDGQDIGGITILDNVNDNKLCARSCINNRNSLPNNNGTEFIVLYIKNQSPNPIRIEGIIVNGSLHLWDASTASKQLNNLSYPRSGFFSIISNYSTVQKEDNMIESLSAYKIVIKLSSNIDDIPIGHTINIRLISDSLSYSWYINSGDVS